MFTDTEREPEDLQPEEGLSLDQFTKFFYEILHQPAWRSQADKEADYKDGQQINSEVLQKMKQIGMPPAVDNVISVAIESILGAEAKKRTDWRVIPDSDKEGQDVADAYNYKLSQAERKSRADRSCSDAYESQVGVGLGWVEVSREPDPFRYPYRCTSVHRNEIWWDWKAKEPMLDDARYLIRMKWIDSDIAKLTFPDKADLLEYAISGWAGFDAFMLDGGKSTNMVMAADVERGWTVEEQEWRNIEHKQIRLFEVWYREWHNVLVLKMPDGRVVELDQDNDMHMMAIASGIQPEYAIINKVRQSFWAGPHKLSDKPSPYLHHHFIYVPFWAHREDRTGVPFGRIRGMMFSQDNINASISKIRWGLSATVTTRTKGAVSASDSNFRNEISRPDADIILDQQHMAMPGATFKVDRNFDLNEQQYKMLQDARQTIKNSGISDEFQGNNNTSTSGVQFNAQVEQGNQSLANVDDNFRESRSQVGELLLSMIIQDDIGKPQEVKIPGSVLKEDKVVQLNQPIIDEDGFQYLTNDVERTILKVALDDVPSSPSFKTQQLAALSEAYKASPPEYQRIIMPHMMALSDIPDKDEIIKAIKDADAQPSPEQQAMEAKLKEIEIKMMLAQAQIKNLEATATKTLVDAQFASMQAGSQVVLQPAITPVADQVLINAGYTEPKPAGQDPGFSNQPYQQPQQPPASSPEAVKQAQLGQQQLTPNTSPQSPAVPQQAGSAQTGIETSRTTDNLGARYAIPI